MKQRILLTIALIMATKILVGIVIDGYAYLEGQTNHAGIEVTFERISPDSLLYIVSTNTTGYYTLILEVGHYHIKLFKYGYLEYTNNEYLNDDTTLPEITLIEHLSLVTVPDDFTTIQSAIDYTVSGDTIIVSPGIYYENIDFSWRNITVGSNFLTTQDTTFISQTIIDGGLNGSVVDMGSVNSAVLTGFTIQNGDANEFGGGIYCHSSNVFLSYLDIKNNSADEGGGGIYCSHSSPIIENSLIRSNNAEIGGGIFCEENSSPQIFETEIRNNTARSGAGFACRDASEAYLEDVVICDNQGVDYSLGGGVCLDWYATPTFVNVEIFNNFAVAGAGIFCIFHASAFLSSVNIYNNTAVSIAGGILCSNSSSVQFDPINRSNLYSNEILNSRGYGREVYCGACDGVDVIVDTFSVVTPTDFYASPLENFTFDILHSIQDSLITQDVYVSVDGNNQNSGITTHEPFKTIRHALSAVYADSLNPVTIHLLPGTYNYDTNGEIFPIRISSFVSLQGTSPNEVILDAQNDDNVLVYSYTKNTELKNVTVKNGYAAGIGASRGGGLNIYYSNILLENVRISHCFAEDNGGGVFCYESEMCLKNVEISQNDNNNNVIYSINSTIDFINSTIVDNYSATHMLYSFGFSYLTFTNCVIWDNGNHNIFCNNNGQENILTFYYTDLQFGQNSIYANTASTTINWEEGNIELSPEFEENGEFPYSLGNESPCINSGLPDYAGLNLPDLDLADNLRISSNRVDIGAYERQIISVEADNDVIQSTMLYQNYPNPFNPTTIISFQISSEQNEQIEQIELEIFNTKGQKVKEFRITNIEPGINEVVWDGKDEKGKPVASGIYLYQLKTSSQTITKKCLLLK